MTYDFHQASQGRTGHNAPLYASSSDSQWEKENSNCKVAIQKWCCEAPPSKIVMGLAFYGQRYRLTSGSKGVGAPAQGASEDTMTYKQVKCCKKTCFKQFLFWICRLLACVGLNVGTVIQKCRTNTQQMNGLGMTMLIPSLKKYLNVFVFVKMAKSLIVGEIREGQPLRRSNGLDYQRWQWRSNTSY